jgi:PTH2 family peptidyl-tRNA hydrolase
MSNRDVKQVIVVRTKYPDGKGGQRGLRHGKLIAQACHASLAFLTRQLENSNKVHLTEAQKQWISSSFAKICLQVGSEEELMAIAKKAKENMIECHVVTDSGKTEFNGVPTCTCLALGPDYVDVIDKVTAHLSLY